MNLDDFLWKQNSKKVVDMIKEVCYTNQVVETQQWINTSKGYSNWPNDVWIRSF